ncbi:MAG: lipoyl synthase [Vampirovibrionales bacterium]|nr:lipoyl synthase [Vampirovibrionales bacterium]
MTALDSPSQTVLAAISKPSIKLLNASARLPVEAMRQKLSRLALSTVCQEAKCPNLNECWLGGTATLMIGGDTCTRGCRFCSVQTGNPQGWLNPDEPAHVAQVVTEGGWRYVVLTSVDRDDLPDGGAAHWAACITAIRARSPGIKLEVLTPDFSGDAQAIQKILASDVDVFAHNLETVARLTPTVRDRRASYPQSLQVLKTAKALGAQYTKSSLMLGLGEQPDEIHQAMQDLRAAGVDFLTLGQYLQPTARHLPVTEMVSESVFDHWREVAEQTYGFSYCASGPLVRSSYQAGQWFERFAKNNS